MKLLIKFCILKTFLFILVNAISFQPPSRKIENLIYEENNNNNKIKSYSLINRRERSKRKIEIERESWKVCELMLMTMFKKKKK